MLSPTLNLILMFLMVLFWMFHLNALINLLFIEPKPVAKSMLVLDVKPWDDETGMFSRKID